MPLTPNLPPTSLFKKQVIFSTVDSNTGGAIAEGYIVSNPSSPGITVIPLAGGTKAVVPISTSSGNGAPYLKFHFPNGSANTLYVTFAVKNSSMVDGYYDYKTGIPSTYRTALKDWIIGNSTYVSGLKTKSLKFTAYGSSTNKPQEATTFYINFQTMYSTSTTSESAAPQGLALP